MNILAMNFNHDGCTVLLRNGVLVGYAATERFSRLKKHPGVRAVDLEEVLMRSGSALSDIDHVLLVNLGSMDSDNIPERHRTDLKETWFQGVVLPHLLPLPEVTGAIKNVPCQVRFELPRLGTATLPATINPPHHLMHNAASFYYSPFESAVCLAADPCGTRVAIGRGAALEQVDLPSLVDSSVIAPGKVYSIITRELGFQPVFGAGKTMGLAPYASVAHNLSEAEELELGHRLLDSANPVDAIIAMAHRRPVHISNGDSAWNATLAYYAQVYLEASLYRLMALLYDTFVGTDCGSNLCLSGGTALNSVANERCFARSRFEQIYIHPAAGDDGTAIGAALYHWHDRLDNPRLKRSNRSAMYGTREYGAVIESELDRYSGRLEVTRPDNVVEYCADALASGKIVGWFQGASEIGPRALGHRSILADPRKSSMKNTLNTRVKFRESFRPFAPAVMLEHAGEWFAVAEGPFMLRIGRVLDDRIPAVTHVDVTARVQTVSRNDEPLFHRLLDAFRSKTGVPILLNTSFNVRGEPMVETPRDAVECFLRTGIDVLVIGGMAATKPQDA